ncbi:hypothetical protein MKW98_004992, partial [Papaver atlanticum]
RWHSSFTTYQQVCAYCQSMSLISYHDLVGVVYGSRDLGFANGGAYPPDLSLITKARYNGKNYVIPFLLATVILLLVLRVHKLDCRNITLVKHDVQHYFSGRSNNGDEHRTKLTT